jgi:hypothetical protein
MEWFVENSHHFVAPCVVLLSLSTIQIGLVTRRRARGDISAQYNRFVVAAAVLLGCLCCFLLAF